MALLFTTGAFECKFVMATVPCAGENYSAADDDDDYISATEDEEDH